MLCVYRADGYVYVNANSLMTGWIKISTAVTIGATATSQQFACCSPTRNGETFKVWYSFTSGSTSAVELKFVYSVGTAPTA